MKYQLLNPLLDIATTLDPYFNIAYRFGAIFLSEGYPGGPGRPDQGVALLRKALVVMPHKWQYYYDIGFVYYWHLRDFHGAAEWFQRAALQPNAPNWLAPLAASMLVQGQDRASARFMWQQIQRSEEAWLRRGAERALLQLQALDEIDELEAVIRRFPPPSGDPHTWVALVRRGVLLRVPLDPAGAPFDLDPGTGRVTLSSQSPLYPPPDVTRRLQ
jgi:tetratricopeptide (TPR) repeat protein